jgi:tRNA (guanine-N7-)-methyltransferase
VTQDPSSSTIPDPPLSPAAHAAFEAAAERVEWIPDDYFKRVTPEQLFPRMAPVEIDFGCGEGAFLVAMAKRHPERNFLGTERLLGRVRKVCRGAARAGLQNLRLLRIESKYAVQYLLPPACLTVAHVSFPDPWPKRHHQPRRLIQDDFVAGVHTALVPGGELRLKTDDLPYFMWMEKVIGRATGFERIDWPDDPDYPITNFERRFLAQGLPIHRARLRKV